MNKTTKVWIIIAVVLTVLGLAIFAVSMASYDWNFSELNTEEYITTSCRLKGDFDEIFIDVDTTDIEFAPATEDECSILFFESEKVRHYAQVRNGTLFIGIEDNRKWYEFIQIVSKAPKMTVFLPQEEYLSLSIENDTGDLLIPKDFSFNKVEIDCDTSDISWSSSVNDIMKVETDTGSVNIYSAVLSRLNISTDTGDVKLSDLACDRIYCESDTGDISLKNTVATNKFTISSDTGDVRFQKSDAAEMYIKTSTGDVRGTLLSEKVFLADSSTGNISLPKTTSGGKCEITTSTGDIKIEIKP